VRDELCYVESLIEDIRDELDRQGRLQDALFIVCADHGDALGERGFVSHLAGVTEPLIRVPLLINGREVPKKEVTQRTSLNWIYHTISNYFNGDYETDLRKVSSYPDSVGAENTGRLLDIIPQNETKVPEKFYESRTAVFDAKYPNEKFVRIGQQYENRTIEPRTLFESEGTECDGEIVDEFIKSLSVVDPISRRMKKSTEDRLKDLGYLD
jgi:arylsulfatase A-like enzyme